jgi:hypothetical protein
MNTLANLVALLHGAVTVYFLSVLLIPTKKVKEAKWYIIPAIPMFIIQWYYLATEGRCPLMILENYLKSQANLSQYDTGFISHYVEFFFGIIIPDSLIMYAIGIVAMIFLVKFIILPNLHKNPPRS